MYYDANFSIINKSTSQLLLSIKLLNFSTAKNLLPEKTSQYSPPVLNTETE